MKIKTIENKLTPLVDAGLLPLMENIAEDSRAGEITVEHLEIIATCLKNFEIKVSPKDKRHNNMSVRVLKRDNYTCVV